MKTGYAKVMIPSRFYYTSINMLMQCLKCAVLLVCVHLTLAGCVTTTTNENKPDPKKSAEAHSAIAAQYVRKNDLDSAKRHAQKALDARYSTAEAQNIMGVILQREGSNINMKKAEDYFKRAIRYKPDFAQAHNNYGVYLSQLGRNTEAIKQFEIAGAMLGYKGRAASLENLGRTALKSGRTDLAERAFIQALEVNRSSVISKIELVDIFLFKKRNQDAQRLYDDYVNQLGGRQGARGLWQGIRVARAVNDEQEMHRLGRELLNKYPDSAEAARYRRM